MQAKMFGGTLRILALAGALAGGMVGTGTDGVGAAPGAAGGPAGTYARDGFGPTLTGASAAAGLPGTVVVTGASFTPAGRVYVALYDRWGRRLHETRWTAASPAATVTALGGPGSASGRGGTVAETFEHLCGATVMVRAYDEQAAAWSNVVDAEPGCWDLSSFPSGRAVGGP